MNFIETGYLTKDTGFSLLGATETSVFNWLRNVTNKTVYDRIKLDVYPELVNKRTQVSEDITIPKHDITEGLVPADIVNGNPESKTTLKTNKKQ